MANRLQPLVPVVASRTDIGLHHATNQDAMIVQLPDQQTPNAFFAVADGVSRLPNSEAASRIAVEATHSALFTARSTSRSETAVERIMADDPDLTDGRRPDSSSEAGLKLSLIAAIDEANRAIKAQAAHDHLPVMGTTIAGLFISANNTAWVFNIGDSRVYRLRGTQFDVLSQDHVVPLPEDDRLSPEAAKKRSSKLVMYLGQPYPLAPFITKQAIQPGDQFLICSDGLWSLLESSEMSQVMNRFAPEQAAARLLKSALQRGAPDNISLIVISYRKKRSGGVRLSTLLVAALLGILLGSGLYAVWQSPQIRQIFSNSQSNSLSATAIMTGTPAPIVLPTAADHHVLLPTVKVPLPTDSPTH